LESVGKKTIEVINDKDPNLRQTREFIKKAAPTKPNLSQVNNYLPSFVTSNFKLNFSSYGKLKKNP